MNKKIIRFEVKFETENKNIYQLEYRDGEWRGTPGTNGSELSEVIIKFLEENK
jgi:hypothetical protein